MDTSEGVIAIVTHLLVVVPRLIAAHPVASNQFDRTLGPRRVQAVVVGHDLLALRIRKHLRQRNCQPWAGRTFWGF